MTQPSRSRSLLVALALSVLGACSTVREGERTRDVLMPLNRVMFVLNGVVEQIVILPLSIIYSKALPKPVSGAISNVLGNLAYLDTVVNSFAQGKGKQGAQDLGRFALNSTVGIAGIFDVATKLELPKHDEDFGQTLATWGVAPGPYIVLPLIGPSTLRDAAGWPVTIATNPIVYVDEPAVIVATGVLYMVDRRAGLNSGFVERVSESDDPYVLVRDAWLQNREFVIHDGELPTEEVEDDAENLLDELDELDALDDL